MLIVDDEEVIRKNLKKLLSLDNYEVLTAENGQHGLDILEKIKDKNDMPVKVALVDIKMPGMDGIEVLKKIKKLTHQTEVIMITGHGGMESAVQSLKIGAFDYINKPIKYNELFLSISRALERYRIQNRIEKVLKLFTITSELHNTLENNKVYDLILDTIQEIIKVKSCSIFIRNEENFKLELAATAGNSRNKSNNGPIACYPLELGDEKIGEIHVDKLLSRKDALIEEDGEILTLLAKQASVAITGVKLKNLSIRDGLTGLYNHRHFWETVNHEHSRARRYSNNLCLIMIDIDNFKTINDSKGHCVGDFVIKKVSEILKERSRETDIVFRYGGDEFAILLTNTDYAGAMIYSSSIQKLIENYKFIRGDDIIRVTVSNGIASFLEDNIEDEKELVKFADKAMYHAKSYGRNRSICYKDIIMNNYRKTVDSGAKVGDLTAKIGEIYKRISHNSIESIITLVKALEARDPYSKNHSLKVMDYSMLIAEKMGLSREEIEIIVDSSLLHDVGKVGISDEVLLKKGKLSEEEWLQIKKHPVLGADIIKHIKSLESSLLNILHHHEWYNGNGYPAGLKGNKIPSGSRIISVADAFDAMTTSRSYRSVLSSESVIRELADGAGIQFFPNIVYIFLKIIKKHKLLPHFPGIDKAIEKVRKIK